MFFIKRGKKVSGPFSGSQIKQLDIANKIRSVDEISSSNNGPWKEWKECKKQLTPPQTKAAPQTIVDLPAATEPSKQVANDDSADRYFIKRGGEILGPKKSRKIYQLDYKKRLFPSDLFSKSKDGPWGKFDTISAEIYADVDEILVDTDYSSPAVNQQVGIGPAVPLNQNGLTPKPPPPSSHLATCSDCSGNVSKRADTCPHCGAPMQDTRRSKAKKEKSQGFEQLISKGIIVFLLIACVVIPVVLFGGMNSGKISNSKLDTLIKKALLDPSSYEHIETLYIPLDELKRNYEQRGGETEYTAYVMWSDQVRDNSLDTSLASLARVRFRSVSREGNIHIQEMYFLLDATESVVHASNYSLPGFEPYAKAFKAETDRVFDSKGNR